MTKHTPGPWLREGHTVYALDETGNCNRFSARVEGGWKWRGYALNGAASDKTPIEELDANAVLMQSATALLAALDAIMPPPLCGEAWDLPGSEKVSIVVTFGQLRAARAAIAKATGAAE